MTLELVLAVVAVIGCISAVISTVIAMLTYFKKNDE